MSNATSRMARAMIMVCACYTFSEVVRTAHAGSPNANVLLQQFLQDDASSRCNGRAILLCLNHIRAIDPTQFGLEKVPDVKTREARGETLKTFWNVDPFHRQNESTELTLVKAAYDNQLHVIRKEVAIVDAREYSDLLSGAMSADDPRLNFDVYIFDGRLTTFLNAPKSKLRIATIVPSAVSLPPFEHFGHIQTGSAQISNALTGAETAVEGSSDSKGFTASASFGQAAKLTLFYGPRMGDSVIRECIYLFGFKTSVTEFDDYFQTIDGTTLPGSVRVSIFAPAGSQSLLVSEMEYHVVRRSAEFNLSFPAGYFKLRVPMGTTVINQTLRPFLIYKLPLSGELDTG